MCSLIRRSPFVLLFLLLLACSGSGPQELPIGSPMPMEERIMKGIEGEERSLKELAGPNGLLVIFTCNTCPFVKAWDDRYGTVHDLAKERDVGTVLLNSNTEKRDKGDSFEDMKRYAEAHHPGIPYLIDKGSKTANAFGAKTTPHVYLFDGDLELLYRGAIDDHYKDAEEVESFYVKDALKAMAQGEKVEPATTPAKGCSIKRP